MTEEEFTQKQKFEFEDRLSKIRSIMNSVIPDMDSDFFDRTGRDKESTSIEQVYYAGGTLCLDIICGKDKGLIMLNISNETITITVEDKTIVRLMPIRTLWFAFTCYKEVKGFHLKYYRDCYKKSCIRHLYSMLMNRHGENKYSTAHPELDDLILEHAIANAPDFNEIIDRLCE